MSSSFQFAFPLPNGLHARPATHLAERVARYRSVVTFVNERTGRSASARSVLALVATDARSGDPCRLDVSGDDARDTLAALQRFLAEEFLACDEPLVVELAKGAAVPIPRSLTAAGLTRFASGTPASRGLGSGAAVVLARCGGPSAAALRRHGNIDAERAAYEAAVDAVARDLSTAAAIAGKALEGDILRAHLAVLRDPGFGEAVHAAIADGRTAGEALGVAVAAQRLALGASESAYIRERVLDLEDVAGQLWTKLAGEAPADRVTLTADSVVFADRLTPSEFLALDRRHLRGLVLAHGGQTSHALILARSFGIPTVTGVADAIAVGRDADTVILDATLGIVLGDPSDGVLRYYERERRKFARIAAANAAVRDEPACTRDGRRFEVGANIASVEEAVAAFAAGAEGIGLFRTELLFSTRSTAPTEDEQAQLYVEVVRAAAGRPVIIRTLDVGGDKPVPFLKFPAEANPFLGYRGVRFYAAQADLIRAQLRAILRAALEGPVKILVPMVATVDEARLARRLLAEAQAELTARGTAVPKVPLGFMIEVPSTAFIIDELSAEADFFSLGTNDLAQYFFAADRENRAVAPLNDPLQPGFLRLLRLIVDGVHARERWIGLCGELGENQTALPLLVGLGLDEISLAAPRIAATKHAVRSLDHGSCRELLERAMARGAREAVVEELLAASSRAMPMLSPELVLDDVEAESKAEVIRTMVDALHVAGRTADPVVLEEAVWRREDAYSTGFGDGFALPHAKTDALHANSIVVARLARPVEWNALDGKPVDVAILLAIRASDHGKTHLETLARLSRLVMRDEFRDGLRQQPDPAAILSLLGSSLPSVSAPPK